VKKWNDMFSHIVQNLHTYKILVFLTLTHSLLADFARSSVYWAYSLVGKKNPNFKSITHRQLKLSHNMQDRQMRLCTKLQESSLDSSRSCTCWFRRHLGCYMLSTSATWSKTNVFALKPSVFSHNKFPNWKPHMRSVGMKRCARSTRNLHNTFLEFVDGLERKQSVPMYKKTNQAILPNFLMTNYTAAMHWIVFYFKR